VVDLRLGEGRRSTATSTILLHDFAAAKQDCALVLLVIATPLKALVVMAALVSRYRTTRNAIGSQSCGCCKGVGHDDALA